MADPSDISSSLRRLGFKFGTKLTHNWVNISLRFEWLRVRV